MRTAGGERPPARPYGKPSHLCALSAMGQGGNLSQAEQALIGRNERQGDHFCAGR
jgi:hypothetical protein